jgi:hypothetical protein
MMKTAKEIQGDVMQLLKANSLSSMISGGVYRQGLRPRDSVLEDAVVIFTTGIPTQVETGVVTVNIYVPDIDPFNNGVMVEDMGRTDELERSAASWVDSLTASVSCYKFKLQQSIYTDEESSMKQHFVVVKLEYQYFGGS